MWSWRSESGTGGGGLRGFGKIVVAISFFTSFFFLKKILVRQKSHLTCMCDLLTVVVVK